MRNVARSMVSLIAWGCLGLAAMAQNLPPTETDHLRSEVTELRQMVAQLMQRIQTLEAQAAQDHAEPRIRLTSFAEQVPELAEAAPRLLLGYGGGGGQGGGGGEEEAAPVKVRVPRSGVEEGMQRDAFEHRQRWEKALRPFILGSESAD